MIQSGILAGLLVLLPLQVAAAEAADEQEYVEYAKSVTPTTNGLSHLLLSLSEISMELAQLNNTKCKTIVSLYEDFFQGTLNYYQTLKPPAGLNKIHDKLVTATNKFITSLGYFNRFCTSRDAVDVNTAAEYMSQGSELMMEAAKDAEKLSKSRQFD